jgi:hypothetical protein
MEEGTLLRQHIIVKIVPTSIRAVLVTQPSQCIKNDTQVQWQSQTQIVPSRPVRSKASQCIFRVGRGSTIAAFAVSKSLLWG